MISPQMSLCLPEQLGCIRRIKHELDNFDCPEACNGLFADIRIKKEGTLDQSSDFEAIVENYVKYKENYVQNLEFNASFYKSLFGELNKNEK